MANQFNNHNLPEKYAKTILEILRWDTKVRNLVNRKYDGEMLHGLVKVPVRNGEVAIQEYDPITGAELTQSATDYVEIVADKDIVLNEQIDGFLAQAVPDNIKQQRLESGSYSLALSLEAKLLNVITSATGAVNTTVTLTNTTAYTKLVEELVAIKRKKLLVSDIKILVSPETQALLLQDERYTNTASTLGTEAVRAGVVGKVHGAEVIEIPYLPNGIQYIVFAPRFVFAGEVFSVAPTINNLTNKYIGSSALQGRMKPYQAALKPELIHIGSTTGTAEQMPDNVIPKVAKAKVEQTPTK